MILWILAACIFVATLKTNLFLKLVFGWLLVTRLFLSLEDLAEQEAVSEIGGGFALRVRLNCDGHWTCYHRD
jgi:succinate-acetate transporter protein